MKSDKSHILQIEKLETALFARGKRAYAVQELDCGLRAGATLGVVGESGCGKTMLSLSIMRLVPSPPARIVGGRIVFDGLDLLSLSEKAMRRIRGNSISMIFQEPMTSLNPVFTVGSQIAEVFELHQGLTKKEALAKAEVTLQLVGIPDPARSLKCFPHELSGGIRQRVAIAMALACEPALILADEPTTALDVTIQAQILELLRALQQEKGVGILLITHDLGVVAQMCDDVLVMYAGQGVELSPVTALFHKPLHPYTQGLLKSIPHLEQRTHADGRGAVSQQLAPIPGVVPSLFDLPQGCAFHPRCPKAQQLKGRCQDMSPPLFTVDAHRRVRCWLYEDFTA